MAEDPILLTLTGIGLLLNVLSIYPLKQERFRSKIKAFTWISLISGFVMITLVIIAQSSDRLFAFLFYGGMALWMFGFFEIFMILLVRPKRQTKI